MPPRPRLRFVSTDPQRFEDLAVTYDDKWTLGQLLEEIPSFSLTPLDPDYLKVRLSSLNLIVTGSADGAALYVPPGISLGSMIPAASGAETGTGDDTGTGTRSGDEPPPDTGERELAQATGHPEKLGERAAVLIAHRDAIDRAGTYLKHGLSVLIQCEKLLVEHIIGEIAFQSGRTHTVIRAEAAAEAPADLPAAGRRSSVLAALEREVNNDADEDQIVVVPHLDLLAGGANATISSEARELTDVLYERSARVLLAFTDPSLVLPEVLASRFAVRLSMDILPREVHAARRTPCARRAGSGPAGGSRAVPGLRSGGALQEHRGHERRAAAQRMRFAYYEHHERPAPVFADLLQELAVFKAHTSKSFEVPNVPFGQIGGYQPVKDELGEGADHHLGRGGRAIRSARTGAPGPDTAGVHLLRSAGDRQDAVRQGGRQRARRHDPGGIGARGDRHVRRRERAEGPRTVRRGPAERAGGAGLRRVRLDRGAGGPAATTAAAGRATPSSPSC